VSNYLSTQNMQDLLAEVEYMPGWKIEVYDTEWQGPCLAIQARVEDSYNPGEMTDLRVKSFLPPFEVPIEFYRYLRWRLARIAVHESDEWLRARGKPLFDPHHVDADEPWDLP
jgi:hypothetical protein